jgi:ATP-dependent DNA helicase RecG
MKQNNLPPAQFHDKRGSFVVEFYKNEIATTQETSLRDDQLELIAFCQTPRTRHEISKFLGLTSITYAIQTHVMPLVQAGKIHLSIPEKPTSSKQLYYSDNKSN